METLGGEKFLPVSMDSIFEGLSPERVLNATSEELDWRVGDYFKEIRQRTSAMLARIRAVDAGSDDEEYVPVSNLSPDTQQRVHAWLLEQMKPEKQFNTEFDQITRDESGKIMIVTQYRECPSVDPVLSRDGQEYRWYVRRIGIIEGSKRLEYQKMLYGDPLVTQYFLDSRKGPLENIVLRKSLS